jgi:hypothetical protein
VTPSKLPLVIDLSGRVVGRRRRAKDFAEDRAVEDVVSVGASFSGEVVQIAHVVGNGPLGQKTSCGRPPCRGAGAYPRFSSQKAVPSAQSPSKRPEAVGSGLATRARSTEKACSDERT